MPKAFKTLLLASALIAAPASAQLIGGSGGAGGAIGGGIQGSIGSTVEHTTGSATADSTLRGSTNVDKKVDHRSGRASTSTDSKVDGQGSLAGSGEIVDSLLATSDRSNVSVSGSTSTDATLLGTDAIRGATRNTADTRRQTVGAVKGTASSATTSVPRAGSVNGGGAIGASSMAQGGLGQLAASGSGAARGSGNFAVSPGMPIHDTKGRVIGKVQSVKQTSKGVVEIVVVKTGNRTIPVPAANFSGSGDVLMTAMTKSSLKKMPAQ